MGRYVYISLILFLIIHLFVYVVSNYPPQVHYEYWCHRGQYLLVQSGERRECSGRYLPLAPTAATAHVCRSHVDLPSHIAFHLRLYC